MHDVSREAVSRDRLRPEWESQPMSLPRASQFIEAYVDGPVQLRRILSDMTAQQLQARPVPGKWSTCEVVPRRQRARLVPPNQTSDRRSKTTHHWVWRNPIHGGAGISPARPKRRADIARRHAAADGPWS
jgi:hypothetical protein